MLKIFGQSILKPFVIIFKFYIEKGQFLDEWEKAHVPVHKKGDKQMSRNYWPVSLLPICDKIFERLICNSLVEFFIKINLI